MNARLYDPKIGRFFSPDNFITEPENPQSYNRYSYALNNPLNYTDPSGNVHMRAIEEEFMGEPSSLDIPEGYNADVYGLYDPTREGSGMDVLDQLFGPISTNFGGGGGKAGGAPKDPEKEEDKKEEEKKDYDTELTDELLCGCEGDTFFSEWTEEEKATAKKNYKKALAKINAAVGYKIPKGIKVIGAEGSEIPKYSEYYQNENLLLGLTIPSKNTILLSKEFLLNPDGIAGEYYRDVDNQLRGKKLEDVISHEIGHLEGRMNDPRYDSFSFRERENYAIHFNNIEREYYGRPLQDYKDVWPWQYGGWWNKS